MSPGELLLPGEVECRCPPRMMFILSGVMNARCHPNGKRYFVIIQAK